MACCWFLSQKQKSSVVSFFTLLALILQQARALHDARACLATHEALFLLLLIPLLIGSGLHKYTDAKRNNVGFVDSTTHWKQTVYKYTDMILQSLAI